MHTKLVPSSEVTSTEVTRRLDIGVSSVNQFITDFKDPLTIEALEWSSGNTDKIIQSIKPGKHLILAMPHETECFCFSFCLNFFKNSVTSGHSILVEINQSTKTLSVIDPKGKRNLENNSKRMNKLENLIGSINESLQGEEDYKLQINDPPQGDFQRAEDKDCTRRCLYLACKSHETGLEEFSSYDNFNKELDSKLKGGQGGQYQMRASSLVSTDSDGFSLI